MSKLLSSVSGAWGKTVGMFSSVDTRSIRGWFFMILGGLMFLASIAAGLYIWLGWGLVGGITGIVAAFQVSPVYGFGIAIGVVKIMVCVPLAWITFALMTIISRLIIELA